MFFQTCMEFRKNTFAKSRQSEEFPVFEHLEDVVDLTLVSKERGKAIIYDSCGVDKLNLIKEDVSPQAPTVCWQKFEYVIRTNIKGFTQYVCSIQNYTVITLFTGILLPIYSFTSLSRNTTTLLLKCKKHHKTLFYFCCNS